jgi:dienelactone hydrolase
VEASLAGDIALNRPGTLQYVLCGNIAKMHGIVMTVSKVFFMSLSLLCGIASAKEFDNKWIKAVYKAPQPAPTVIVGHGCDGVSAHYEAWAKQINSWGYNTILLDSFGPRGYYRGVCNSGSRVAPFTRLGDVREAVEKIKASDYHSGKIGYIGFSHGGAVAMQVATADETVGVDAVVAYYPNCKGNALFYKDKQGVDGNKDFSNPTVPTVLMLGAKDEWTPIKFCLDFNKAGKYEVNIYDNASHAFDINLPYRSFAGHTLWYDAVADKDSREKTKNFFQKQLN